MLSRQRSERMGKYLTMKRKQRNNRELRMYLKALRYGARYATPAVRELIVNKRKRRGQQILRYYKRYKDAAYVWLEKETRKYAEVRQSEH